MIDANIAEASLELAAADDAAQRGTLLRAWALRLTDAESAAVIYCSDSGDMRIGDDVSIDEQSLPDGWHRCSLGVDGNAVAPWSPRLLLLRPAAHEWERIADILLRHAHIGTRHERQQHALVEAGKALSSERTLDGVLRRIVEQAMALTNAQYGALGVLDANRTALSAFVTVGIDEATAARIGDLPTGRGILGALINDARPLRLARLQDDSRSVGFPAHHPPMESFLGVPIVTSRSVAGRIYLTEKQGAAAFTQEDEDLVATLATQAAIAIDNAELNDQLRRTAVQLEEASRHKSSFLANMSHELRSPLNTIIGYTRLLLEDPRSLDQEQIEDLEIVRGSGEHLLALITELLDLQRIEAGRVTLVLGDENLQAIIESVLASIRPSVPRAVQLRMDVGDVRDPRIHCDATRLRQILLNLLGNAVKFTERGSITLRARDDDDRMIIEVADTGHGIPDADQARIFESFFQSDAALSRTPHPREGAGLGLAITQMLTQLHGGSVQLHSELGVGTTVTVELPRTAEGSAS